MPEHIPIKVRWTSNSLENASAIKKYLSENFSQKEIDSFYLLLSSFENAISAFPNLYPETKKNSHIRRAVLSKVLSSFYRIKKTDIEVLAVLDNRCDLSDLI